MDQLFIETRGTRFSSIYVANYYSNTVTAIDPVTKNVEDTITVGFHPVFISPFNGTIYVANSGNTVSVIDPVTKNVTDTIAVGDGPAFIFRAFDELYVANHDSNTVSVIDPVTNNVTDTITVGDGPAFITQGFDAIYVANFDSDNVSVIDPVTKEVIAGTTFDIIPFRGGQINCNGLDAPVNRYFYVPSGTECVAKPKNGY
jgi:YVTN family beta-propeller protein